MFTACSLICCLTAFFVHPNITLIQAGTEIRSDLFSLKPTSQGFSLHSTLGGQRRELAFERDWLIPSDEEEEEEFAYVSSFEYSHSVNSFPVGNGSFGLHVSSFEAMAPGSGSAMAVAGRDVFLIFDPEKNTVMPGIVNLGITKDRVRSLEGFAAVSHHFLIADINQDGLVDVGIIREVLASELHYDEKREVDVVSGPFYKQFPVKWYVFEELGWLYESGYDGRLDFVFEELPLIEISLLPIDFAAHVTWNTYDSRLWASSGSSPPAFIPEYRKKLSK